MTSHVQGSEPHPSDARVRGVFGGDAFFFGGKLRRFEQELAMGRFLRACQTAGDWVAVKESDLIWELYRTASEFRDWRILRAHHRLYEKQMRDLRVANFFTLGLWGWALGQLKKLPEKPEQELGPEPPYADGTWTRDARIGFRELIELGYLTVEDLDENDRLLRATPELKELIRSSR